MSGIENPNLDVVYTVLAQTARGDGLTATEILVAGESEPRMLFTRTISEPELTCLEDKNE